MAQGPDFAGAGTDSEYDASSQCSEIGRSRKRIVHFRGVDLPMTNDSTSKSTGTTTP